MIAWRLSRPAPATSGALAPLAPLPVVGISIAPGVAGPLPVPPCNTSKGALDVEDRGLTSWLTALLH